MLKKVLLTVLAVALISTAAFAEDVYVTKKGKKYHKEGSHYIKGKNVEKITREEAEKRGLKPSKEFLEDKEANEEVKK